MTHSYAVVAMDFPTYPNPDVLLTRLVQSQGGAFLQDDGLSRRELERIHAGDIPSVEFLDLLAEHVGLQRHDLFLIAGLAIPDDALRFDRAASRELPELVQRALTLSAYNRQHMRDCARSMAGVSQTDPREEKSPLEQYPPGFGSLLVRMLALRNLGWSSAAKVIYLMSGVYLSAATVGAVGRGVKEIDGEILDGFAAVLGVPAGVLASLIGAQQQIASCIQSPEIVDTAGLLWDVRHLAAAQVQQVSRLALTD